MTPPRDEFEALMPEPYIRRATTGNLYTADQLRAVMQAVWDKACAQHPASFKQYWTEDGRNLCRSPLGSFEARMHERTWNAATERAANLIETCAPPRKPAGGRVEIGESARKAFAAAVRGER